MLPAHCCSLAAFDGAELLISTSQKLTRHIASSRAPKRERMASMWIGAQGELDALPTESNEWQLFLIERSVQALSRHQQRQAVAVLLCQPGQHTKVTAVL
jgi:hypothetical protein